MEILPQLSFMEDDQTVIEAGYKPQLERTLSFFPSFAVAFSFMSILMGIFAGWGFVLTTAGPFGLWSWPIVAIGQFLVALVFAEMAGRIPLTGSLYNWNSRMSNQRVAWLVAWMLTAAYIVAAPGVIVAMMTPFQTLFGVQLGANTLLLIAVGVIVVHALINIYGVKLTAYINKLAVLFEILALIVFGSLLVFFMTLHGAHTELVTKIPTNPSPYLPVFLMSILMAAFTIFGFESVSDLSEETVNVKQVAPRAIISTVGVIGVFGFLFLLILTLAIPDVSTVAASADPVSTIISAQLGGLLTKVFLAGVVLAIFAVAMLNMLLASRLVFAVARDKMFPGSEHFERVSLNKVPANALIFVAFLEILIYFFFSGFVALYAAPVVLLFLAYLVTIVNYLRKPENLPPISTFSLGIWRKPIAALAGLWLFIAIAILTIPKDFNLAAYIALGVLVAGAVIQLFFSKSDKTVH